MSQPQIPLSLYLDDSASFENFLVTDSTRLLLNELRAQANDAGLQWLYLHGAEATGKSHLLQASARAAAEAGRQALYLPMAQLQSESGAAVLSELDGMDLICLDGLDLIAGEPGWERALFNCYNALLTNGGCLLIAAKLPPAAMPVQLPDLMSRLQGFATFHLPELNHEQRKAALRLRAECRGLSISDEVVDYIFNRGKRDLETIFTCLDHIDRQAMMAQRRLTVPFVRSVMDW